MELCENLTNFCLFMFLNFLKISRMFFKANLRSSSKVFLRISCQLTCQVPIHFNPYKFLRISYIAFFNLQGKFVPPPPLLSMCGNNSPDLQVYFIIFMSFCSVVILLQIVMVSPGTADIFAVVACYF